MINERVTVIGAGLAGTEAALQLASRGIKVRLIDIKPDRRSPAHNSGLYAELVCSNSLKSDEPFTASGLLKAELRFLKSFLIEVADGVKVPAGGALAVDRELFSARVSRLIAANPLIEIECREAEGWSDEVTVIATGPLTTGGLQAQIEAKLLGGLHFYDAAAPIVAGHSIDRRFTFSASRYGRGGEDYLNCPLNRDEYERLVAELTGAQRAIMKAFESDEIFAGCMPVEVMAARGKETLRFGPLRPVGFTDPVTGKRPYAVLQLRRENAAGDMYNLVGFQTNLLFKEQQRVFAIVPALQEAEYLRFGVMHRNSYVNAPKVLRASFRCRDYPRLFIAGQLAGVEGYVESIASGLMAALNVAALLKGEEEIVLPAETIIGSLCRYLTAANEDFQPMNANFGLLPPLEEKIRDKRQRKSALTARSLSLLPAWSKRLQIL